MFLTLLVHQDMVCVNISAICPQHKHIDSIFKYGASTGQILLPSIGLLSAWWWAQRV